MQSSRDEDSFEAGMVLVEDDDDEEDYSDDGRPQSLDDKTRQKEMRKGIDLATTLERIEKNFVITDPRLPDNPIVRSIHLSSAFFLDHVWIYTLVTDYLCWVWVDWLLIFRNSRR